MNQGNAAAIPTTIGRVEFGPAQVSIEQPAPGYAWDSATHADRYPESTHDPILALVTELRETNRLIRELVVLREVAARRSAPVTEPAKLAAKSYPTL